MTLSEAAKALGIESYPEDLQKYEKNPIVSIVDTDTLHRYDSEFNILGVYREKIFECIEEVKKNEALLLWGNIAASYLQGCTVAGAREIRHPPFEEDTVMRFFPALILCALFPSAVEKYRKRGFGEEEIHKILDGTIPARIASSEEQFHKQGLDEKKYYWMFHHILAMIFRCNIFTVTPRVYEGPTVLKNKKSGEIILVARPKVYHKSGMVLGSAGFTDAEGSFTADFYEDEYVFKGHPVLNSLVSSEICEYSKSEWNAIIRAGDGIASIHIPRGANLARDAVLSDFDFALEKTKKHYADMNPICVACTSWLMNPLLAEILGENSNIAKFLGLFRKYPNKSGGREGFGFVFPKEYENYEELPEDTTLQRKLKQLYIGGGHTHIFSGVYIK